MTVTLIAVALVLSSDRKVTLGNLSSRELTIGLLAALVAAFCQSSAVVIIRNYLQGTDIILGTAIRLLPAFLILALNGLRRGHFFAFAKVLRRIGRL